MGMKLLCIWALPENRNMSDFGLAKEEFHYIQQSLDLATSATVYLSFSSEKQLLFTVSLASGSRTYRFVRITIYKWVPQNLDNRSAGLVKTASGWEKYVLWLTVWFFLSVCGVFFFFRKQRTKWPAQYDSQITPDKVDGGALAQGF